MLLSTFRRWIQLSSTVLTNSYIGSFYTRSVSTSALKGCCVPFLNCYACPTALFSCPIGAVQHFMTIHTLPYYVLALIGIVGLSVGRMACGWLCPFGFLQDMMHRIGSPKFKIPFMLRYVKYGVLILLVGIIPYSDGRSVVLPVLPGRDPDGWNPLGTVESHKPVHRLAGSAQRAGYGIFPGVDDSCGVFDLVCFEQTAVLQGRLPPWAPCWHCLTGSA